MRPARIALALLATLSLFAALPRPAAAAPDGTMIWGVHVTLASRWLDPAETEALVTPFLVLYALHDAVVKPMTGAVTGPSLAESWTTSRDGLVSEFLLRKNARFHNGDPVTSDDVKFSFERYKGAAAKLLKDRVKEIQTPDPGRVRIVLKEPWPDFMTFDGTMASGAAWVVKRGEVDLISASLTALRSTARRAAFLIHDRVTHAPLMESAFLWAIGPRVEESGLSLVPGHAYSAPYEDVKLKRP